MSRIIRTFRPTGQENTVSIILGGKGNQEKRHNESHRDGRSIARAIHDDTPWITWNGLLAEVAEIELESSGMHPGSYSDEVVKALETIKAYAAKEVVGYVSTVQEDGPDAIC